MTVAVVKEDAKPQTAYFVFEPTRDPEDGGSPISRWLTYSFDYEDQTASVVGCHVPPMSHVMRVALRIDEAFTGTTAVTVGDGDAAAGWIASGVITPTTAGDFGLDYDASIAVVGKLYQDGDTIDVTFTGVATAGSATIFIEVISYHEALTAE